MGAKNRRDIKKYSGVILHCSHLEPLELQGMHPLVRVRDKMEGMKKNYASMEDISKELKNLPLRIFETFMLMIV